MARDRCHNRLKILSILNPSDLKYKQSTQTRADLYLLSSSCETAARSYLQLTRENEKLGLIALLFARFDKQITIDELNALVLC